jgi:hypothetical protein
MHFVFCVGCQRFRAATDSEACCHFRAMWRHVATQMQCRYNINVTGHSSLINFSCQINVTLLLCHFISTPQGTFILIHWCVTQALVPWHVPTLLSRYLDIIYCTRDCFCSPVRFSCTGEVQIIWQSTRAEVFVIHSNSLFCVSIGNFDYRGNFGYKSELFCSVWVSMVSGQYYEEPKTFID